MATPELSMEGVQKLAKIQLQELKRLIEEDPDSRKHYEKDIIKVQNRLKSKTKRSPALWVNLIILIDSKEFEEFRDFIKPLSKMDQGLLLEAALRLVFR